MDGKKIIRILHLNVIEPVGVFQDVGHSLLFWKVQRNSDICLQLGVLEQLNDFDDVRNLRGYSWHNIHEFQLCGVQSGHTEEYKTSVCYLLDLCC
jgi:hypothetical protein